MKNTFFSLLLVAILGGGLLLPSGISAFAQRMDPSNAHQGFISSEMAVTAQLESMLKSRDVNVQVAALQDITLLASKTLSRPHNVHLNVGTIDYIWNGNLTPLTPQLLTIFRTARHPGQRIMAANALYLIGDDNSLEQLIELNQLEPSKIVRQRTNRMLVAYYTGLYPELHNGKKITTAKIHRAKHRLQRAG